MPSARPVSRNRDRNPNLGDNMKGKHGYKMPMAKERKTNPMTNSIRASNVKRMGGNKMKAYKSMHNPY